MSPWAEITHSESTFEFNPSVELDRTIGRQRLLECKDQTALYWYAYMHMEYNNYHLHNLADTSILAMSEFKHVMMIDEHDGLDIFENVVILQHLKQFAPV